MLQGKKILLGVTGGIAIYKVCDLVSKLKKLGVALEIIMTEAAQEFVTPLTFQTMGKCKVYTEMFHKLDHVEVEHISLSEKADLILVAPATANTIAKVANGIADNLLTATILASKKPVVFATAMNTNMLQNPITQSNMNKLEGLGYKFIHSNVGMLACDVYGDGRMAEPLEIIDHLEYEFSVKDLVGKKVIVTAGPTVERIDPVRYITNDSSGKMGYAIAQQAYRRGAAVQLISGPTKLEQLRGVETTYIESNDELFNRLDEVFLQCDALIMAAAPSDYRPKETHANKMKKTNTDIVIELVENRDIIKHFAGKKGERTIIGFSAETNNLHENALRKLQSKNLDYIVANDVSKEGAGFNYDTNIATIIGQDRFDEYSIMPKEELADKILDLLVE